MSTRTPVPVNNIELEEMLNERDERLGESIQGYIREQAEATQSQLKNELQLGMAEFLRDNREEGFAPPEGFRAGNPLAPRDLAQSKAEARQKLFNKRALGAQLDELDYAQTIGTFLQAIWHRAEAARPGDVENLRNFKRQLQNALAERVPSTGGFLVPEVLRSQILMVALETALVRPRARIIPMDSLRVPYPTIDDTSHTTSVFGGVIGYWTEEAAALTASQPAFGRIELEAKKLTGYTEIPNELLQDAVAALDQWFNEMFPIAIAWFEDVAFIAGSGSGQPQGFTNAPCAITGAARVNGAGNAIAYADLAALYARMLPISLNNAVWVCSPDVLPGLLQLTVPATAGGTSGVAPGAWLPNFSAADGLPGGGTDGFHYRLLGRPLIVSEKMPALSAAGCLAFVDFGYYLLGDRQAMQISSSEHYKFANDLTAFRVTERVDGRTWIQSAITPENGGNTLSPVVLVHA